MIIRGGGGWGGVLTSLTSTSFTLRKMQTLHMLSVVSKTIPTKGSSWPKPTTNKISLLRLRLIIFEVVCGINPIEPLLLVPNKWMEHGNTWKNGDLRRCSTKNSKTWQKKVHLGLQLDMASQCCLVADCGFCIATSALAPLASRRGNNWKSECRPDMIRTIENHKVLMFFSWPLKSRIESPRRRNAHFHSWVTRLPTEMNVHVANIFWRLPQIPAFCLLASKIRISNSSPLQGRRVNRLPAFTMLTSKWASRRSRVHFFNNSTSKSAPGLMCFSHFDFETRFALPKAFPRMKCLAFQLNVLRATTACAFPTSQLPKVLRTRCVFNILTSTCVSCHGRLHFLISSNQMPPHPLL